MCPMIKERERRRRESCDELDLKSYRQPSGVLTEARAPTYLVYHEALPAAILYNSRP